MLALTCRLGRLPSAAAAAASAAVQQPRRGTVVVARNHEVDRPYPELDRWPLREVSDYPDRVPVYTKFYETAEVHSLRPDSQQLLSVRLSRDVPGLGEAGRTVSVHRSRYWHYLYPLGWASIVVTQQQQSQSQQGDNDWRNSRVFTGALFRLQRTLESMHLLVPISRDAAKAAPGAQLSERHLCVAFRRYGVEIPRRAICLPEKPPPLSSVATVSASAAAARTFKVGVQLNSLVTVSVKASLHPVMLGESGSGLPTAQLTPVEVDDWLGEMHPMPQLPQGVRVFENRMLQQGPPDFQQLLRSNRSMIRKKK